MSRRVSQWWSAGCVVAIGALVLEVPAATKFTVGPGLTTQTNTEVALAPDPQKGIENAQILVEEMAINEDLGTGASVSYHMRAKIFTTEARSLADVKIYFNKRGADLKEWWGRVLQPDGSVQELTKGALKQQSVAKVGWDETAEYVGALPGVGPGSVIDFGYTIRYEGIGVQRRLPLQREYYVNYLRYRWRPSRLVQPAWRISRGEGLKVTAGDEDREVWVEAHDLPPVKGEPMAPPLTELSASALFYYLVGGTKYEDVWDLHGKREDRLVDEFAPRAVVQKFLATLNLPTDQPPLDKARAVHDWIGKNLRNLSRLTAEEEEIEQTRDQQKKRERENSTLKGILETREAYNGQLQRMFVAACRQLGLDAYIVATVDRTEKFFDEKWRDETQFDGHVAAIRLPGQSDSDFLFDAPGSGLPFGQVPWWFSGVRGLLATKAGGRPLLVMPTQARQNLSEINAAVTFDDTNSGFAYTLSRKDQGGAGYTERLGLRRSTSAQRREQLEQLCGKSSMHEISRAEAPELRQLDAPFHLECAGEVTIDEVDDSVDRYSFAVDGPWFSPVPGLTAKTRRYPVVLDYPPATMATLTIKPPHGFKLGTVPAPIKIEKPFGRYLLTVTPQDGAFVVQRVFALLDLVTKPDRYPELLGFLDEVRQADRTAVNFDRVR